MESELKAVINKARGNSSDSIEQSIQFLNRRASEIKDYIDQDEPRCPRCGETKANHGNYATGEDWTCPDQDGYGKELPEVPRN